MNIRLTEILSLLPPGFNMELDNKGDNFLQVKITRDKDNLSQSVSLPNDEHLNDRIKNYVITMIETFNDLPEKIDISPE